MDRAQKRVFVEEIGGTLKDVAVVVVARYQGLTVADMQRLRGAAKGAGVTVKVAKNRLARIAVDGAPAASIAPLLKGPTLLAWSTDPVAAPKVATDFAKLNEKLVILGGALGATALNPDSVRSLATMPSLDELHAKLIGLIQAPGTKLAQLANAPAAKLARVFAAYADKDKETAEAA